jgi:hypothetical protein
MPEITGSWDSGDERVNVVPKIDIDMQTMRESSTTYQPRYTPGTVPLVTVYHRPAITTLSGLWTGVGARVGGGVSSARVEAQAETVATGTEPEGALVAAFGSGQLLEYRKYNISKRVRYPHQ